jgi:hypothetical protein
METHTVSSPSAAVSRDALGLTFLRRRTCSPPSAVPLAVGGRSCVLNPRYIHAKPCRRRCDSSGRLDTLAASYSSTPPTVRRPHSRSLGHARHSPSLRARTPRLLSINKRPPPLPATTTNHGYQHGGRQDARAHAAVVGPRV